MGNASSDNGGGNDSGWAGAPFSLPDTNTSNSNDNSGRNDGRNDSSSNNSKYHSDNNCSSRCGWINGEFTKKDPNDSILCVHIPYIPPTDYSSSSSSSSSSNRSSNSTSNSVDREGVNDDRNSNSYSSGSSNYDVIGNNVALRDIVKYLKIISPDKKHSMNCKKITSDEYTKLKEKLLNDGWSVIGFAKFHELMYYLEFLYQYKLTETTYIDYEDYIYLMNLLKSDNNTSTHSVAKTITQTPIVKQTTIQTPVVKTSPSVVKTTIQTPVVKTSPSVVKTTIQTPVVKTSTLSFPKKKESIDKYTKISNDLYSQYNSGKITASEYLKVQNNVSEVYEKNGHLISTSVQFSNQVYLKISEDAGKQYKAGKLKPGEYAKICNDARTKYYTEPVSTRQNSIPTRVENGYVMSAQVRVNAVNLATSAVSNTAQAIVNGAVSVGNELISIHNDSVFRQMETDRLRNEASQQLVSNVASSVVNGVVSINNDTVIRQMETDRLRNEATIQLVSNVATAVVNNAPQVIQETAEGVSSFGFEVATQVFTGYNPTGLAISGANAVLSSINNRERNVVETTCEAIASGIATYAGGQLGSVIATGLLVRTAIETNANVVGNIIQEEINRHQQGDI